MDQGIPQKFKLNLVWIAVVGITAALLIGGYFLWRSAQETPEEKSGEAVDKSIEAATQGVLPTLQSNPLEKLPEINPMDKANPFKGLQTNPFE